jgi:hypothetical protein
MCPLNGIKSILPYESLASYCNNYSQILDPVKKSHAFGSSHRGLRFHSATDTLLKNLSPEIRVTRTSLAENWRRCLKIIFRR